MFKIMQSFAMDLNHNKASSHAVPNEYATKYGVSDLVVEPVNVLEGVSFLLFDKVESLVTVCEDVNVTSPRV